MKKWIVLISLLIVLICAALFLWYREGGQLEVRPLTTEEKVEDLQYLFNLAEQIYPFYGLLEQAKGLESFEAVNASFLDQAKRTTTNQDFLRLVYDYLTFLGQAGHAQTVYDEPYNPLLAMFYNIDKQAYRYRDYWRKQAAGLSLYVHSGSDIKYEAGRYVLVRDYSPASGMTYPAGSVITKVNGLPVDDYVKSLQTRFHLQMDPQSDKLFIQQLFCIDPGNPSWEVQLTLPQGTEAVGNFPVSGGYKEPYETGLARENVMVRELDERTGYIRIFSFGNGQMDTDRQTIEGFMNQARGRYEKLIIDIRNNGGGEDDYWANLLVKPLLQSPVTFAETGSVRQGFLDRYGWRFTWYRQLVKSTLTNKDRYNVTNVREIPDNRVMQGNWATFQVTRSLKPERTWGFQGKLYLLANSGTYSAADHFAAAVRQLKLGTVVGTNTAGGSSVFMEAYRYALPNSGLIFKLETDLNWNADGQINEIYGTMPDVWLEPSYSDNYETSGLLNDPWIDWVRKQP